MRKKYKISDKWKLANLNRMDFEKRIEVVILRNQGWTLQQIADKWGTTKQAVLDLYKKVSKMTVKQLEEEREKINT